MQPHLDREALWFFEWAEPLGVSVWSGGAGWYDRERPFLAWAEREGFEVDVAVSQDLEQHSEVLDGHRMFLSVGHVVGAALALAMASSMCVWVMLSPAGKARMQPFCAPEVRNMRVRRRVSMPAMATVPCSRM